MLILPEGLAQQPFKPVANDCVAAGFTYGYAYTEVIETIFAGVQHKQLVASGQSLGHNSPELTVYEKPAGFRE